MKKKEIKPDNVKPNKFTTIEKEEIRSVIKDVHLNEQEKVDKLDTIQRGQISKSYFQAFLLYLLISTIAIGAYSIRDTTSAVVTKCNFNHDSIAIEKGDSIIFNRLIIPNDVRKHFNKLPLFQ